MVCRLLAALTLLVTLYESEIVVDGGSYDLDDGAMHSVRVILCIT
jgi:hypothetical protein